MPGAGDEVEGNETWASCVLYEEERQSKRFQSTCTGTKRDFCAVNEEKRVAKRTATYIREQMRETTYIVDAKRTLVGCLFATGQPTALPSPRSCLDPSILRSTGIDIIERDGVQEESAGREGLELGL